jgi:hypothetical protein
LENQTLTVMIKNTVVQIIQFLTLKTGIIIQNSQTILKVFPTQSKILFYFIDTGYKTLVEMNHRIIKLPK